MKKSTLLLILCLAWGTGKFSFAQSIIFDPKTTGPTEAKVVVNGTGPAQNLWGPYYPISSERMGIKAVAPPASGTKTTAIAGIVDQYSTGGPTGEATGVLGFSASKSKAHGLLGIADGYGAGSIVYGVKGYATNISSNTSTYGGMFTSWREGSDNSNGYGIYAGTNHYRSAGTGNSYGGYFYAIGQGISNKVGVLSEVDHLTSAPVAAVGATGFQANITGAYSSQVIGLYSNIATGGNNGTYGAKLDYTGVAGNSASIYGLQTNVKGTGAASYRYGAYIDVDGSTWNNSYGIYARSNIVYDPGAGHAANGLNSYGGYFVATGSSLNQFGIYATSDANLGPNVRYAGYFAGNVHVSGTFTNPSDERFKKNLTQLDHAIDKVMALNPSTYEYKTEEFATAGFSKGQHYGFTAQAVQKILPQLVSENTMVNPDEPTDTNSEKYLSVNYIEIIPILTKALQEQQEMIKALQAEVEKLKK